MKPAQFKELWEIRFQKILDGEKAALVFYKDLMQSYKMIIEGTKLQKILEHIAQEEAKHARIAHELLNLVRKK